MRVGGKVYEICSSRSPWTRVPNRHTPRYQPWKWLSQNDLTWVSRTSLRPAELTTGLHCRWAVRKNINYNRFNKRLALNKQLSIAVYTNYYSSVVYNRLTSSKWSSVSSRSNTSVYFLLPSSVFIGGKYGGFTSLCPWSTWTRSDCYNWSCRSFSCDICVLLVGMYLPSNSSDKFWPPSADFDGESSL